MSSRFFSKVHGLATKSRLIDRAKTETKIDDEWLYEASQDPVNYYDNSLGRSYENPKRATGRKSRSDKRTFGYRIPTNEESVVERPLRRVPSDLTYRRNRTPRAIKPKENKLILDIIEQKG